MTRSEPWSDFRHSRGSGNPREIEWLRKGRFECKDETPNLDRSPYAEPGPIGLGGARLQRKRATFVRLGMPSPCASHNWRRPRPCHGARVAGSMDPGLGHAAAGADDGGLTEGYAEMSAATVGSSVGGCDRDLRGQRVISLCDVFIGHGKRHLACPAEEHKQHTPGPGRTSTAYLVEHLFLTGIGETA